MFKYKNFVSALLMLFFLLFSFYPTIFELSNRNNLADQTREFILEHNYYWPDYNLYLSKIRQGFEGHLMAQEKYTSERHTGSLIQEFYVILGLAGRFLGLEPNSAYLLGRIVFSLLLLLVIVKLIMYYFPTTKTVKAEKRMGGATGGPQQARSPDVTSGRALDGGEERQDPLKINYLWQLIAFLIVVASGSFPRFFTDSQGLLQVGRYMEWWSNIDALQRITFIPHILFGQVVSFYLLYRLIMNRQQITRNKLLLYIILGNLTGLVFPPSLITLDGVLLIIIFLNLSQIRTFATLSKICAVGVEKVADMRKGKRELEAAARRMEFPKVSRAGQLTFSSQEPILREVKKFKFIIFSLPSLIYIYFLTKQIPWNALVIFHRTHPMMIPFGEYILGTGPIFFLGLAGAVLSIINRDRKFFPLIYWILVTFFFAIFFTHIRDQSPLRFTQTGLFIPLGILGTYFFQYLSNFAFLSTYFFGHAKKWVNIYKIIISFIIAIYIVENLFMMKVSLTWQVTWITQRLHANIPPVPYPPQAMYPLKAWMDGIRWLRDHTDHQDAILAQITAGNYIPAYSGNTVYFGQANTYNYERKQLEVNKFFKGEMGTREAELFLASGRIKYVFESLQEKELSAGKNLTAFYPFLKTVYSNPLATIYLSP